MQFVPVAMRQRYAHRWPLSHTRPADRESALTNVLWVELLDKTQMRHYFPDGLILSERLLGLTKSIIAVKGSGSPR
jgi:hypothetical protein